MVAAGECIAVMRGMADCSVHAIVTDPPYGLGFMGKKWDALPPGREWAEECLRVLKPGGHLLAFGGTRTYHRLACALEDAGFEIRDTIAWMYGSGFPKSLDVSKAIDKAEGAEREIEADSRVVPFGGQTTSCATCGRTRGSQAGNCRCDTRGEPATTEAQQWSGWGTALKPAHEPIVMARKPLIGTVAANVLEHDTGALNVEACRVATTDDLNGGAYSAERKPSDSEWVAHGGTIHSSTGREYEQPAGRWPANVLLDPEAAALLDEQTGELTSGANPRRRGADTTRAAYGEFGGQEKGIDSGGASRFFYVAKASSRERNAGLERFEARAINITEGHGRGPVNTSKKSDGGVRENRPRQNTHPTVKPIALMRWLVRLVTPPGGVVLDPFAGSGTTGCACALEGFEFVGVEREPEYVEIANARIAWWASQRDDQEVLF